jgi:serine/threonine-protein kinase
VALVVGSGSVAADNLYDLLRRRLLILNSLIAALTAVGLGIDLLMLLATRGEEVPFRPAGLGEWLVLSHRTLVMLVISSTAVVLLWRRPPAGIRGLRLIEVCSVGALVILWLITSVSPIPYGYLEAAATVSVDVRFAYLQRYALAGSYVWCVILVLYGAFIPNTWRWCVVVVVSIAASPLVVFSVYAFWLRPLDLMVTRDVLVMLGFSNAISAAIAIFASSRIEILRRQATEARRLGQYVLKEQVGAGGMGEVYRAEHVLLRRPCALKVIRPGRAGDPKHLRRFEREVQVTATLTHPNTVQIYDYGHAQDGTFYYVMEYLPGRTLEELVRREGPLPPARAVHFLRQVCGALREAHGRGLIHRDIKPGNVMVCERGGIPDVVKLLDFGLVLPPESESDGGRLTQDGAVTGTPAYLSPEQAGGQEKVDARSDIYSVGAVAYFLLTGQPLFAGRSGVKMLAAHLYEEPERLSARRPGIPADLEAVVLRCLAKATEGRFPDVDSLDRALAACGPATEPRSA